MDEKFRKAEEEYFILRGKFDTGRIGKNLFELALKDMAVQDTKGRWWMIGADSGNWYMHDGKSWTPADPAQVQVAPAPTTPVPPTTPGSTANSKDGSSKLPVVAAIGCIAIICLAVAVMGGYGLFNLSLRPSTSVNVATLAALRSPIVFTTPTSSFFATSTITSVPTDTLVPPTDTPFRTRIPSLTPTPAYPPGVYVIGMRTDPTPPRRGDQVVFYPNFLNSTGSVASYRLVVNIYRPGETHAMGESFTSSVTLPLGQSEQPSPGWGLGRIGGCEDFVVRVGSVDDQRRFTPFMRPNGSIYEQPITVCP